ncbi:OLC1v1026397C1 [Oldenlandia corymbosa var. corymbosa]|uniref:OLC1v1026397C1 n=2 Tax=Oldenlandia corymbosa var. corymbosa TaxID=529605 RepID=A0AAV1C707_OLDCO|nr:OLC1v1026397C1 [Oldenlandia corymbosa var. corymbosa]
MVAANREMAVYCFDTLVAHFNGEQAPPPAFDEAQHPLFVTWKKTVNGCEPRLRGCIGTLEARAIINGFKDYALTSALRDRRFPPIQAKELPHLECTVSLLTNYETAQQYDDWEVGKHGMIIEFTDPDTNSRRSATYLPEVAAHEGWTQKEAIDSLMRKAGRRCLVEGSYCIESDLAGMSQRGLIYSFVAKGTVVLAEHTSYSGNFSTIAVQCLQKLSSNRTKYTFSCDGHTFNFLLDSGFVFLVVADETMGRSVPFVFLERVKDDFKKQYAASIKPDEPHPLADDDEDDDLFGDRFSIAYNLDREFGPKLKEHMQYCMSHPEEMSKLSKIKAQLSEVKGVMMDNIEKVLDRGEKIELLVDKTENLQFQADTFQRQGRQLRRKMWLQNLQMKLMVGGAILILILIFWLIACGGFKC